MVAHVVVYTRVGCKLCEQAERVVTDYAGDAAVEIVDVDTDPELEARYGVRVPVVAIDGVERFELFVDEIELIGALRG